MNKKMPRLLLAGTASSSGKTTVACAVLRALIARGMRVASFKCGPDYIDPMFHHQAVGTAFSSNLDLFLSDAAVVNRLLASPDAEIALLEGAMGYYDGVAGKSVETSAYDVARTTQTPAVLVIDCRGLSVSAAAVIRGFLTLRADSKIQAVILNRLSPALYPDLKDLIERECDIAVAGFLPPMRDCGFESRHLGLVADLSDLEQKLSRLAEQAERTIDISLLLSLAQTAPPIVYADAEPPFVQGNPRIAVAQDAAFSFYYADSLALLQRMGAELIPFSPLTDQCLPEADGLLLGGGYPELYAQRLSKNNAMRTAIQAAVTGGMPTVAECGGFLYLHRTLEGADGVVYPMVGAIAADGVHIGQLSRFGYIRLTAKRESLLFRADEPIPAHEFHYWDSTDAGEALLAQKPQRKRSWLCGHVSSSLYAGFAHLYFAGHPQLAARFLTAAAAYRKERSR